MILKDHKKIESISDRSDDDEVPPLKDCSDVEIAYSVEREALITRCVLTIQVKEDVDKQRENIFHT
jgi:hypothetical protein